MYGFVDDNVPVSGMGFGLNQNVYLTQFEYTENGGKGGAAQEALDITFNINGTEKGYRQFPVTSAFIKGSTTQEQTTDPTHKDFIEAQKLLSQTLTHIIKAFVPAEQVELALATPVANFREYCELLKSLLPENFDQIPLDLFMEYQYKITGTNDKTYLQIPKNLKNGQFLHVHVTPVGAWTEDRTGGSLKYIDGAGNVHPLQRNSYYMTTSYANQKTEGGNSGGAAMQQNQSGGTKGKW